jgi:chaperonin GroEL (HSP60 family)
MFISNGFASSEFVSNQTTNDLILENPLILVVSQPIKEIEDIVKVMEFVKTIDRPLVIFSPEIAKEPLSVLLYNQRKTGLNVCNILIIFI